MKPVLLARYLRGNPTDTFGVSEVKRKFGQRQGNMLKAKAKVPPMFTQFHYAVGLLSKCSLLNLHVKKFAR